MSVILFPEIMKIVFLSVCEKVEGFYLCMQIIIDGFWNLQVAFPFHWRLAQSYPTLCSPMDCNLSGSSVHGIFQARVLEWVAISFSTGSSQPRDQTQVSCIAGSHFTIWAPREALPHQDFHFVLVISLCFFSFLCFPPTPPAATLWSVFLFYVKLSLFFLL